ncbi:hypothetical protein AAFF_G00355240 [Aldrovandia affinis]|uniref:Ankyrin repeat domain-containing protein 12 n=1 Tax=Aldrovandia affinis TaxID=143900 RepID=A0AAD7SIL7_9TELE|nr:hypothetical protein AAFF_G00355240 [Aldrovandia affinis]
MAKPWTHRDGTMVEKQTGKKSKDNISSFTKTPKLDQSELLEMKPKSSMKRKLTFTLGPHRSEERDSDTDSDPGHSSETWGDRLSPPCRIYTDKDGPEKKKVKKETGSKKTTPVNILFGYPLSERKQMALLMQMTARDNNSPDCTPGHPSQVAVVQKKICSSAASRQKDKVNKRNERGETALHMAAIRGDAKQVKELISLGADVNVKDFAGWTPIHEACNFGYCDVAKVLIAAGAEVNTQGLDDDTPLHDASSSGHKHIVRLLLRHGGNAFQANNHGERPVDVADSKEIEQLLKSELKPSDSDDSSPESEDPSSADDNREYSDTEKDSDGKQTNAKNASASTPGLDEYEFKDEEEALSKTLKSSPPLRQESKQQEKDAMERKHFVAKQERCKPPRTCKSKKRRISRILYCSSEGSSDETSPKRKSLPTTEGHKAEVMTRKELNLTVERTEKGKVNIKNKNKEDPELKEDRKESCKVLLLSTTVAGLETPEKTKEEDSFKMSFSPKYVHLFPLSSVKSPKHNHSVTDKKSAPVKQEGSKLCISIGDRPSEAESVKHNHYVEPGNSSESSCSKGFKHKEKNKHHHKDLCLDGGGENPDDAEGALQKTDQEGKVIKKHKPKHQEKDNNRKENDTENDKNSKETETEMDKHRQREARKDGHRNLEFDREFWKEDFFKNDENEDLLSERTEMPESDSLQKATDASLDKEERIAKEKDSCSKDRKQKEEREKDKDFKREKEELPCKEEKGKEVIVEEITDSQVPNHGSEDYFHNTGVKEEQEDNLISEADPDNKSQDRPEKAQAQEKTEKRFPGKGRECEKVNKKHSEREKKVKTEHIGDKFELHTDKWKEREKAMSGSSHSLIEKNLKESEKPKAILFTKKPEDNKKSKEKPDRKNEKEKQEKERCPTENREKEKNGTDKKGKTFEKIAALDLVKLDRIKETEKDYEKKKKEKIREVSSSGSNLQSFFEERRSSVSESSKTPCDKTKQKEEIPKPLEKDKGDRDRDSDRHRDKHKDKFQQMKTHKIKLNEAENDRAKSKSSPAPKDARPKEKRLVNDDLMQTSFERMLSLKDQEIEQWHRKHKEKIKQKERERMKHQPVTELSKLKNKDRVKNSVSEPYLSKELHLSKELIRSVSDTYTRERALKEATSARSISLDTKSLPYAGKTSLCLENNMSHSPKPESDKYNLISRSVSMISVASSEDPCQTIVFTPRPLMEYDSDCIQEHLDSHLRTLQSSFPKHALRSPAFHENESDGFIDGVEWKRTSLSNKQEAPYLRSTPDKDGKPVSTDSGPFHELGWSGVLSGREHSNGSLPKSNLPPALENHSSQGLLFPSLSNYSPETPADTERIHSNPHVPLDVSPVTGPGSKEALLKDSDQNSSGHVNLSQADTSLQTTTGIKVITDPLFERTMCQEDDSTTETSNEKSATEGVIKESLPVDTSGIRSLPISQQPVSTKVSDCCGEHQDVCTDICVDLLHRPARDSEQKEKPSLFEDTPCCEDRNLEDQTIANHSGDLSERTRRKCEGGTGLSTASIGIKTYMAGSNAENSSLNASDSSGEATSTQEGTETDGAVSKDTTQGPMSVPQSGQREFSNSTSSTVTGSSAGGKHQLKEYPTETQERKEKSGTVEIAESVSLPTEAGPQAHTTADAKPETCKEMTAFLDAPEDKFQHLQRDSSDSSHSGLRGDFSTEHSDAPSGGSSPQPGDGDSDSSGAKSKIRLLLEDDVQLPHPRKRRIHQVPQSIHAGPIMTYSKEKPQRSLAAIVDSLELEEIQPYQTERANPYYEFLHIRRKIEEKRKVLCSVIPQAPQYYEEYVTFNGSYLLDGNPFSKLCIPTITPPPSLPEPLKDMFKLQEVVRMKLRLQHSIEREKLILSNEQEVLRVHYRAARTLANQALPFSACTVLLDAEVYNMPQDIQGDDGKSSVRDRFNARQFMSWLQDVDDKFDKLKICLLMRQQHEAAALNAVQRLEWQLKQQELDPATYKSASIFQIPEFYIPLVDVNDHFELAPIHFLLVTLMLCMHFRFELYIKSR